MIVLADPHLGRNGDTIMVKNDILPECGLEYINSRTYDLINRMNYAVDYAVEHKHSVVISGDLFNIVSPSTLIISIFTAWLGRTIKKGVAVHILPGNHDSTVTWANSGLFLGLEYVIKGLAIIDEVSVWEVDGMKVLMIPHIPRDLITDKTFDLIKNREYDYIVGHGQIVSGGNRYENDCFYEAGKAVEFTFDMFKPDTKVILGHEHAYHMYKGANGTQVWYPGSVVENNYGEAGEEKRFAVVNGDTVDFREYPELKYPYFNIEIDLTEKDFNYTADELVDICSGKLLKVKATAKDALAVNQVQISKVLTEAGGYVTRFETILVQDESDKSVQADFKNYDHRKILQDYLGNLPDLKKQERLDAYCLGEKYIEGGVQ